MLIWQFVNKGCFSCLANIRTTFANLQSTWPCVCSTRWCWFKVGAVFAYCCSTSKTNYTNQTRLKIGTIQSYRRAWMATTHFNEVTYKYSTLQILERKIQRLYHHDLNIPRWKYSEDFLKNSEQIVVMFFEFWCKLFVAFEGKSGKKGS